MKKLRNYASQDIFPLEVLSILLSAILLATVYSLFETPLIMVILFGLLEAVISIPFMLLCHFTNTHRKLGTLLCLLVYGGLLFILSGIGFYTEFGYGQSFVQWVAQDIEDTPWIPGFGLVLCLGGAMFFGTVGYYFTVVRYRMGMLVVVSIVPCVLYAKAVADVNNWYLVFIAGMNVIIAIVRRRYDQIAAAKEKSKDELKDIQNEERVIRSNKSFSAALISTTILMVFTATILIISAAIPKKSDAIYYDQFEDTFLGGDTNSQLIDASGALSDISGNADGLRAGSNRRLYRVTGDVSYLKRQCFDVYDFENDRWYPIEEYQKTVTAGSNWEKYISELNISKLQAAIKKVAELSPEFAEKYGVEEIVNSSNIIYYEKTVAITSLNFAAEYYVAPPNTKLLIPEDTGGAEVTWAGTYVRPIGMHDADFSYRAIVMVNSMSAYEWCVSGGSAKDISEFRDMLSEMNTILLTESSISDLLQNTPEYFTVLVYEKELEDVEGYKNAVIENTDLIPDSVRELAAEITADCTYDWDKALALENYFHDGQFVYDLNYRAPDDSVEYFLFESKRGTCSDYATAYVLLARACGLTVRYCEGYVAQPSGNYQVCYVKESDGHAFPEVYIPGAGWNVFEPTSGVVEESGASIWSKLFSNINMDLNLILTISIIVAAIAIIIIIIRLIIPFVLEKIFISQLKSGKKSATDAYNKILKKVRYGRLKKKYRKLLNRDRLVRKVNPYSLTPAELNERFAETGIDSSVICNTVETVAYRNPEQSVDKNKEISEVYKKIISIFK